jgi:hypothetical protein
MTFRGFLDDVLLPMFPGVEILDVPWQPQNITSSLVTFAPGANRLRVRENMSEPVFLELSRAQPFDSAEKALVENLVRAYADVKSQAGTFLSQLEEAIIRQGIAKSIAGGRPAQQRIISTVLETFLNWATQTYEGERVSSGCLITTSLVIVSRHRTELTPLFQEDFAKNLTDGVDSWWRIAAIGGVIGFETSEDQTTLTAPADAFFPQRYRPLAVRTAGNTVGIALNRNGEILVFAGQKLRFAMRRGIWVNFAHDSIVKQMSAAGGAGSTKLRQAIYASSIDVSFARSGGCIGLLRTSDLKRFREDEIVAPDDRIGISDKLKPKTAATLVSGRSFATLSRSIRKELLGLDGALVLRPDGSVYAAGAILKLGTIDLGNQGGRSAAAKTLSRYGLGVKISEDGMISGYKKETGDVEACFKVG